MGSDRSSEVPYLRGLGVLDKRFRTTDSLWADESSYTEQNPRVGVPVAQQTTSMLRLESAGTQSSGSKLRVKGAVAGQPRPGQGGINHYLSTDSVEYGHDPPHAISMVEQVQWLDGGGIIVSAKYPHVAGLDTDVAVCVATFASNSSTYGVRRYVSGGVADLSWGNGSAIYTTTTAPPSNMDYYACVADGGDGVAYCAHWVFDTTNNKAQVRVQRSTDSGSTWSTLSSFALKESVDTSTYEVGRLRLAISGDQALLIANVKDTSASNYEDRLFQWTSDSRARFFELVEEYDSTDAVPVGPADCVAVEGGFVVGYVGATGLDQLYVRRLPFSAAKLSEQTQITASNVGFTFGAASGTPSSITDSDFAMAADDNGALYLLARIAASGSDECVILRSHDFGLTWAPMGNSNLGSRYGKWWEAETANYHPKNFSAAWCQGSLLVLSNNFANSGTYENSVTCWRLGGYSSLTWLGIEQHKRDDERTGLQFTWFPMALPSVMGWTKTGAGTTALTSSGTLQITTSTTTAYYTKTTAMPGTTAEGQTVLFAAKVNSGGSLLSNDVAFQIAVGDGSTTNFIASIRMTTTSVNVYDETATVSKGSASIDMTSFVWFLASIDDGAISVWYRTASTGDRFTWTNLVDGVSLSDGSGATGHRTRFGNIASATADSEWLFVGAVSDEYNNPALASGFTNPDDLMPRFLGGAGRRVYVNDGVRIMATSGPVDEGEVHNIDARGDYPIDRLWFSASPTRRRGWRSVDTGTTQDIAWYYDSDLTGSGDDSKSMSDTVAFVVMDTSVRDIEIYGLTGGASPTATLLADVDTIIASGGMARSGSSVVYNSGLSSNSNTAVWPGMLQGGTVKLGSTYRRISENTGGVFQPSATNKRAILTLEDAASGDATSSLTGEVWSPHVCIVINLKGVDYAGFRLRFPTQTTATGDMRASFAIPFWVAPMGFLDANGWAKEDRPGVEIDEGPDLVERPVEIGPARRVLEMQFSDAMDLTQFNGAAASPDYILASENSGAEPVAALFDTVPTMQGILRQSNGRDCVLVIERLDKVLSSGSDVTVLRSYGEDFMLATQTGPVRLEHIFGQRLGTSSDEHGELVRGGRVAFREVT